MKAFAGALWRATPERVRAPIRQGVRAARYAALRAVAPLMRPFVGIRAPLAGFDVAATSPHVSRVSVARELYVAVLPNGRALFDYGVVVDKRHKLLGDVSPALGLPPARHPALSRILLPPREKFSGRLAVISSTAHQRYYHWMFDVLPRVGILRRSGLSVDAYLINTGLPYQRESIDRLALAPVVSPQSHTHIQARELIVPSLPGQIGQPTPQSCSFLRETFLSESPGTADLRLYVSRRDAATRGVSNEAELIASLEPLGFQVVALDGMSIASQADLFARCRTVVGPHGAGLTNTVFCPTGAALLEFMPDLYFNPCFEVLAKVRGLRYQRLAARSTDASSHAQTVDVAEVLDAIAELERGYRPESPLP